LTYKLVKLLSPGEPTRNFDCIWNEVSLMNNSNFADLGWRTRQGEAKLGQLFSKR